MKRALFIAFALLIILITAKEWRREYMIKHTWVRFYHIDASDPNGDDIYFTLTDDYKNALFVSQEGDVYINLHRAAKRHLGETLQTGVSICDEWGACTEIWFEITLDEMTLGDLNKLKKYRI